MSDLFTNFGLGVANSVVTGLINQGLSAWSMARQNRYNVQMHNRQVEAQRQLIQDAPLLNKMGLMRAGYSTADPNGTGFTAQTVPMPQSPSDGAYGSIASPLEGAAAAAQIGLAKAQINKLESETKGQDILNYLNSTYGDYERQAGLRNVNADTEKKVQERIYTAAQTKVSESEQKSIEQHLQMDWIKLEPELQLLCAQVYQLESASELNKANADLCYQKIKESQEVINTMITQQQLNKAQAATAYALASLYAAQEEFVGEQKNLAVEQTKLTKNQASTEVFRKGLIQAQEKITQFQDIIQEQMGLGYYKAKSVAEAVLPIGFLSGVLGKAFGLGAATTTNTFIVPGQ